MASYIIILLHADLFSIMCPPNGGELGLKSQNYRIEKAPGYTVFKYVQTCYMLKKVDVCCSTKAGYTV